MNKKFFNNLFILIPARSGSKSIKNKNIIRVGNKPLIKYTIDLVKNLKIDKNAFISTDCEKIKRIAISNKINLHKRKKSLARDNTLMSEVILNFINNLNLTKDNHILLLQPTSPLRTKKNIIESLRIYHNSKYFPVVSICKSPWNPIKSVSINGKFSKPFFGVDLEKRRQDIKDLYSINGSIYIFSVKDFKKENKIPLNRFLPYHMKLKNSLDIDDLDDLELLKEYL